MCPVNQHTCSFCSLVLSSPFFVPALFSKAYIFLSWSSLFSLFFSSFLFYAHNVPLLPLNFYSGNEPFCSIVTSLCVSQWLLTRAGPSASWNHWLSGDRATFSCRAP